MSAITGPILTKNNKKIQSRFNSRHRLAQGKVYDSKKVIILLIDHKTATLTSIWKHCGGGKAGRVDIIKGHLMEQVLLLNLPKSGWTIAQPAHLLPPSLADCSKTRRAWNKYWKFFIYNFQTHLQSGNCTQWSIIFFNLE